MKPAPQPAWQSGEEEYVSLGSTATVELTMLAEAPPRTELPTVASAFCVAHISPSDLPAALRERLALRRILGVVRSSLRKSPRIYNLNTVYLHYPLRVRSGLVDSAHLEAVHDDAHVFKVIQRIASHQAQETHGRQRTKVELVERNLHKISARRLHTQRGGGVRGLKGCMSGANG